MIQSINYLKSRFETADRPTQTDFSDWLDSFLHRDEVVYAIANHYTSTSSMLSDQINQIAGTIQYVSSNNLYYEFLGTTNGLITDYNAISSEDQTAAEVSYDHTASGLSATDVQGALDEVVTLFATKADASHTHVAADVTDFQATVSLNTDVAANVAARHSHTNKTLLDSLISSGSGTNYLSDDGTYKAISGSTPSTFSVERHLFTAGASQTDFVISGATANEIVDILAVRVEGVDQDYNAYSVVTTTVARDTVRLVTAASSGDIVSIEYFKGTVITVYPNPEEFTDLTDSPAGYSGEGGKLVRVNAGETALEFVDSDDVVAVNFTNGFDLQDEDSLGTISWNGATRTISIAPKSGQSSFHFWVDGDKVIKTTSQSVVIPTTTGTYYVYFDNSGVLQSVLMTSATNPIFYEYAIVALVYWNSAESLGLPGNERHGIRMSSSTHHYNHSTYGARYESGIDISGLSGGTKTYTGTSGGYFWDEDIKHTIASQSTHYFLYREGSAGGWKKSASKSNEVGLKETGDSYYSWNENTGTTWQLTEGTSSTDFWITFFLATPNLSSSDTVYKIMGQNAYSSRGAARDAIYTELDNISTDGLPSPEFVFLYAVIVRRNGNLITLDDGSEYLDLRRIKGGAGGSSLPTPVHEIKDISSAYTVTNSDNGLVLHVTGATTITFPDDLNDYISIRVVRAGTSTVTLSASTTLNSMDSVTTITKQWGYADVQHAGSDIWTAYVHT